jgi:hypothetical protein
MINILHLLPSIYINVLIENILFPAYVCFWFINSTVQIFIYNINIYIVAQKPHPVGFAVESS